MAKQRRWSAKQKTELVLNLLRGESIEELSRSHNVAMADIAAWRNKFLEGGENSLKKQAEADPQIAEYQKLLARKEMVLEILKKKRLKNHPGSL